MSRPNTSLYGAADEGNDDELKRLLTTTEGMLDVNVAEDGVRLKQPLASS